MKIQDCFVGQKVGVYSKSKGVLTGTLLTLFETKDTKTNDVTWYASVDTKHFTFEVKVSKLLGII